MRNLLENPIAHATLLVLFLLALTLDAVVGAPAPAFAGSLLQGITQEAAPDVANTPTIPPDPWEETVLLANTPTIPPDPWEETLLANTPTIPPDPWEETLLANTPTIPPDPWEETVRAA